jgi:hypothetical protein
MHSSAEKTPGNPNADIVTSKGERPTLKAWTNLALGFAGLVLFLYVIGPAGLRTPLLEPMATFIEENDINANAYFYTEVDEFYDAERHMRDHLGFMARGGH